MFMKSLMRGKLPKTQEEVVQEQRESDQVKKSKFEFNDNLIKQVHRNVAPILINLKNKESNEDEDELNFNKEDLLIITRQDDSSKDYKLAPQKPKVDIETIAKQEKKKKPRDMTEDDIKRALQDIDDNRLRAANSNYLNLFGLERGRCQQPQCQKLCPQYRGSYNIKSYQGVELFSCLNCKCPMNSHEIPLRYETFSNLLSEELSNKYIESNHLNFKSLVALFLVWPEEEDKYAKLMNLPDFIKERRQKKKHEALIYNANLEKLVQIFNEGCFDIISYFDYTPAQLFDKLVEKKIFSIKKPVPKQDMDSFLAFIKSFQKAENSTSKIKKTENKRNLLNNERDLQKFQIYQKYKDKIQAKFDKIAHSQHKSIDQAKVYVMLISSKYSNPYTQFRKFLVAAKSSLPQEFVYYYSSKYKYKGIIDCQQFFPDFFKINYQTFILAQHIPKKVLLQSKADGTLSEERIMQKQKEIRDREVKKNDDKLRDYLDFNNFCIIEEDFEQKAQEIEKAFNFVDDDESNLEKFLKFCQIGSNTLNVKICAKIGPPTYTTIGGEAPNVYRITEDYDNENIANHLCESLSQSQRVAVILRPLVVKSKMDEVLINIFRINDFIVVNRIFTLLTLDQAKLLAKLEGVSDDNKQNYISMMREGIVQIILLTKPGGIKSVQILSNGCQTGLKLQKTNYLDELYVEHEQGGVKFKEMIQKQFFNVFQSYTNLNMFSGIQEFFNLERLIFQDINNDEDETGSLFINQQTKQVHYDGKQQVLVNQGKRYTPIKRNQIVESINQERFNFFVFCPKDELSTEQIVSVFMSECANIELIHIILKPPYITFENEVRQQLSKLKFKVWNVKIFSIQNAHDAKQFVESLQILKNTGASTVDTDYNTDKFAIFSCVKPAGRREMLSFLQDFKVEYVKGEVSVPITAQSLKHMLIPCHTDQSHDLAQHYINPKLRNFNGEEFVHMSIEDQAICTRFMLESTFATSIYVKKSEKQLKKEEKNKTKNETLQTEMSEGPPEEPDIVEYDIKEKIISNPLYAQEFKHFIVRSEDLGFFEVRIHDPLSQKPYEIDYIRLQQNFKLTSWYYSLINKQYMQRSPLSYQYRMMPDYKTFEKNFKSKQYSEIPTHIFDVGEYCGGFFLETVADQMKLYRKYEITEEQQKLMRRNNYKESRGSVVSYLWGMRLAKFVKEMENLDYPTLEGFGTIISDVQGQFRGFYQDNDQLSENLMQKYREILDKIKKQLELNKSEARLINRQNEQVDSRSLMIERIKAKISEICKSSVFKYSREKHMRRILPSFVENEHLRVRVDNREIHKRLLNQDYQTQDEFFENRDSSIDLKPDIKKLQKMIKDLLNYEKLESETKFNSNNLKKRLKEEDTTFDMVDIEKRIQFLDDDSSMVYLIHQITNKKNKVNNILKQLQTMEEEEKKRKRDEERQLDDDQKKQARNKAEEEAEDENAFKLDPLFKHIDKMTLFLTQLNEKYNGKNGKFNLATATRINTFSFAYVLPEIKSKYSFVANILYLIDVQFKSISTKYHLTDNNEDEYRQLITALETGFKNHYKMDPEDMSYMREKYQDERLINRERQAHIPDFIKIEQFLLYLTQMERNLALVDEKSNIFARILDEKQKEIREFKEKMASSKPDENEWKKLEEKWEPLTDKIMMDKKEIEQQILKLLEELDRFETDFSYEDSMNQEDQSQPNRKVLVKKDNFFLKPYDRNHAQIINDPSYHKFLVDILDIPYKYDAKEEYPNMKRNEKYRREPLLEKYGDQEFLQDATKDPLQKTWLYREPLLISHMRPVKADDRNYVLVENIHKDSQSESEKAIQKEIRRFKVAQGIPLGEDEDEEKQQQILKQKDYAEYQRQLRQKQMESQRQQEERYNEDNPDRSANMANDIIENYMKMIREEKQKLVQERQDPNSYYNNKRK